MQKIRKRDKKIRLLSSIVSCWAAYARHVMNEQTESYTTFEFWNHFWPFVQEWLEFTFKYTVIHTFFRKMPYSLKSDSQVYCQETVLQLALKLMKCNKLGGKGFLTA